MPEFPFALTERARLWAEYTGTLAALLELVTAEIAQLYDDMVDPDLPPDHPEQLTVSDICFHTFELGEDEYICMPDEVGGWALLMVDLCKREAPTNGIVLPKPEST